MATGVLLRRLLHSPGKLSRSSRWMEASPERSCWALSSRTGEPSRRFCKEILQKSPVPQDFLVEAAAINPEIVRAQQLRGNKEVALTALSLNGLMLHYLLPDLRADPELASVAIRQNPDAMGEVHPCLRREKDLLNIQTEGLARRARLELRRMKAEAAAAEAAQAMQEAIVPDADTAADAAENAAADAAAEEA